jgi:hypothetical protein
MKKTVSLILLMCMVLSLAACGKAEITMQEIYAAGQTEALHKNHESVYIREEMDGDLFRERYQTKEYIFDYFPGSKESAEFITDDALYCYMDGAYLSYLFITPDGVTNDFSSERADRDLPVVVEDALKDTIESVTEKDGRITVKTFWGQEPLEEFDVASGKFEYVLDAKTREVISVDSNYDFDDGSKFSSVINVSYDTEEPEMLKTLFKYKNQTEDLRTVTVVSNPGTDKEVSQSLQTPKGLIIGFMWDDAFEGKVELYADAACTQAYDPYVNTDSDLTVYVKWNV